MSGFKELKVWQNGIDLVLKVYKITESFPKSEIYGLSSTDETMCSINSF